MSLDDFRRNVLSNLGGEERVEVNPKTFDRQGVEISSYVLLNDKI